MSSNNAYFVRFYCPQSYGTTYNNDISINYPSTDTAYHAYTGTTINIDWEDEAGTVYGGTLDVKTGELIVTHNIIEFDGSNDEDWNAQNNCFVTVVQGIKKVMTTSATNHVIICNSYKSVGVRYRSDCPEYGCIKTVGDTIQIAFKNTAITDYTTWRQTLSANPITVVYELATPIKYDLTPNEVRSLLGINNVWADCGAITELKYIRDLNLCINDIISRIEALEGGSNSRSLSVSPVLTKSLTSELDTVEGKTEEATEEETKEEAQNER